VHIVTASSQDSLPPIMIP